jgi:hypothetical protein
MISDHQVRVYNELMILKNNYCKAMDTSNPEYMSELFTEDCVFVGKRYAEKELFIRRHGITALKEMIEQQADLEEPIFRQHRAANPVVFERDGYARGRWHFNGVLQFTDGSIELQFGYYDDKFRKVDGQWKISYLTAEFFQFHPARQDSHPRPDGALHEEDELRLE